MRRPSTKVVDVETERKAPAPGLKEKDEEEKSGIGMKGAEEKLLAGGYALTTTNTKGQKPEASHRAAQKQGSTYRTQAWKSDKLMWGFQDSRASKSAKGQHLPECPGKEEEKVKKGPECRAPRL